MVAAKKQASTLQTCTTDGGSTVKLGAMVSATQLRLFTAADRCADCCDDQLEKFKPHELPPYETMQFKARAASASSGKWKQLYQKQKQVNKSIL